VKAFATEWEGRRVTARRLNEGSWPYKYEVRDQATGRRMTVLATTHIPNDPDEVRGG